MENTKNKSRPKKEDFSRWENEGGNPDPRLIAAKNSAQVPRIVAILRDLFMGLRAEKTESAPTH